MYTSTFIQKNVTTSDWFTIDACDGLQSAFPWQRLHVVTSEALMILFTKLATLSSDITDEHLASD